MFFWIYDLMYVYIQGWCVAWTLCIFFLCLSERLVSGSIGKVDAPPIPLLPRLERSSSVLFLFLYLNTLYICLRWILNRVLFKQLIEGSAPFLRFFLFFWCLWRFLRGFWIGQEMLSITPAWAVLYFLYKLFGYICSCCRGFKCLSARLVSLLSVGSYLSLNFPTMKRSPNISEWMLCSVLGNLLPAFLITWWKKYWQDDSSYPKIPIVFWVLLNFQKDCSATAINIPGSLQLSFCFPCHIIEKFFRGVYLLFNRIFGLSVFTFIMWGGEDK